MQNVEIPKSSRQNTLGDIISFLFFVLHASIYSHVEENNHDGDVLGCRIFIT